MNGPKRQAVPTTVLIEAAAMVAMAQAIQHLAVTTTIWSATTTVTYGSRPTLIIK